MGPAATKELSKKGWKVTVERRHRTCITILFHDDT